MHTVADFSQVTKVKSRRVEMEQNFPVFGFDIGYLFQHDPIATLYWLTRGGSDCEQTRSCHRTS